MSVAVRSPARKKAAPDPADLLAWYDRHRRALPWRARKGDRTEPYRVWLSEIMLQQTTVKAVAPYYTRFLAQWPTVERLAAAERDDVLRVWAGLGYYAQPACLCTGRGRAAWRDFSGRARGFARAAGNR
jgi:A/G-specific adenine glycosylase